jgi:aryl-alcohol dehydrogenase-like predicted oxidoreductase
VIVNRPFDGGLLFNRVGQRPLPAVARDLGCENWAQMFLKWILAHPAVTCAIPATTNPAHAAENMGALLGPLPDPGQRQRIAAAFDAL